MPRISEPPGSAGGYPLANAPDLDDWVLFVQDGTVRAAPRSVVENWLTQADITFPNGIGPILTAPNGAKFRLTVSNTGVLTATSLGVAHSVSAAGVGVSTGTAAIRMTRAMTSSGVGVSAGAAAMVLTATTPMTGFAIGTVFNGSGDVATMDNIAPNGFTRSDFSWKTAQPTNTTPVWTSFDTRVSQIQASGNKVLAMLGYSPTWVNGGNADDKVAPLAGFESAWQNYCYLFALRYIPLGVRHFELWNEPNITTFWKPAPNVYDYVTRILIPGAVGLRQAATELGATITVLTAGTAPASSGTVTQRTVTLKSLSSNVATLTTSGSHGYTVGKCVDVRGVGAPFDGAYMITAVTSFTFSYVKVNANITSTSASGTVDSGTGTNIDPRMFVHGIYGNGGQASFDALAHHPYTWPFPPNQDESIAIGSYNPNQWNTMVQTKRLREIMVTWGDQNKRIWCTEVGGPSRNAEPTYPTTGHQNFMSHATLATRINQIADYWYTMDDADAIKWIGPMIYYQHANSASEPLNTNTEGGFGVQYNDRSDKPNGPRANLTAKFAQYA